MTLLARAVICANVVYLGLEQPALVNGGIAAAMAGVVIYEALVNVPVWRKVYQLKGQIQGDSTSSSQNFAILEE